MKTTLNIEGKILTEAKYKLTVARKKQLWSGWVEALTALDSVRRLPALGGQKRLLRIRQEEGRKR